MATAKPSGTKQIFFLSGEHVDLARAEVLALTESTNYWSVGRVLVAEHSRKKLENRLAYTHAVYDFLFESTSKNLLKDIDNFNWQPSYKKNYCARIIDFNDRHSFSDKQLGSRIWHRLKSPKVELDKPATEYTFFVIGEKVFVGKLNALITKDFQERRPHLRPILHPTSLHPKLARACINLTGLQDSEKKTAKIADLLCGSGGILIELGLMGFPALGVDNDKHMMWKAKVNLDYFRIKNYKLKLTDATKFKGKLNYVISDLPYGKNTKKAENADLERFYLNFLLNLRKILQKKAVIIFPSFSNYKTIIRKAKFKLENEFTIYIHASLSRKICVIT